MYNIPNMLSGWNFCLVITAIQIHFNIDSGHFGLYALTLVLRGTARQKNHYLYLGMIVFEQIPYLKIILHNICHMSHNLPVNLDRRKLVNFNEKC